MYSSSTIPRADIGENVVGEGVTEDSANDRHKISREQSRHRGRGRATVSPNTRSVGRGRNKSALGCSQRPRVERVKSASGQATEKVSSRSWVSHRRANRLPTRSIISWLVKAYPHVRAVARPEACIEIRRRDESSISRRPMRLLRSSPPTRLRSVRHPTMSLR